jgi:hypothetical protein
MSSFYSPRLEEPETQTILENYLPNCDAISYAALIYSNPARTVFAQAKFILDLKISGKLGIITQREIATMACCHESLVAKAKREYFEQKKPKKESRLLSDEIEEDILKSMKEDETHGKPWSRETLVVEAGKRADHRPSRSFPDSFRSRHKEEISYLPLSAKERARMKVTIAQMNAYVAALKETVREIDASLLITCDESGVQSFCDARVKKVFLSARVARDAKSYAVDRGEKWVTLMGAVNLFGTSLPPMFIIKPPFKEEEFAAVGLLSGQNCRIAVNETARMNETFFLQWMDEILFKHVRTVRAQPGKATAPAVLLTDNCSCHLTPLIKSKLTSENIRLLTYPPNSTDRAAPLDLVIFGAMKSYISSGRGCRSTLTTAENCEIANDAWVKASSPLNIRSAFQLAGIVRSQKGLELVAEVDSKELEHTTKRMEADNLLAAASPSQSKRGRKPNPFGLLNQEVLEREEKE